MVDIPLDVNVSQPFTISITNLTNFTHADFYYNDTKYNTIYNPIISGIFNLFSLSLLSSNNVLMVFIDSIGAPDNSFDQRSNGQETYLILLSQEIQQNNEIDFFEIYTSGISQIVIKVGLNQYMIL